MHVQVIYCSKHVLISFFFFNGPNYNVFNESLLCHSHRGDLHIKQVNRCVHHAYVTEFSPKILKIKSIKMTLNDTRLEA